MIEIDLRVALINSPEVTAIIDDRVFALEADGIDPGDAYVVYRLLRGNRGSTLRGSTDCREARIEINCYAPEYKSAKLLAQCVQEAIETRFECVFNGDQDFMEKETGLKRVMLDYTF